MSVKNSGRKFRGRFQRVLIGHGRQPRGRSFSEEKLRQQRDLFVELLFRSAERQLDV
jgi:hypothetical protein